MAEPPHLKDATFIVDWIDGGRSAQHPPDPRYPEGIDVRAQTPEGAPTCTIPLPYPAPRCGQFLVQCMACDCRVMLCTAGRADDPRSVALPCRRTAAVH